ncbi:MAG: DUF3604 domain-containing protein [Alphaproteobacteria bacterium]|nr:DUF3604 domain-containing protein [Alphaproteobacteria bacterium]
MRWYHWTGLVILALAIAGYVIIRGRLSAPMVSPAEIEAMRADVTTENEAAFTSPEPHAASLPTPSPLNNVYFGDLHVHSNLSFDAYIFGNRRTPDAAYRFAKGQGVDSLVGERMQLAVPLDFAAVTDHAEGFGLQQQCADPEISKAMKTLCRQMESPSVSLFLRLRAAGEKRPPARITPNSPDELAKTVRFAEETWAEIVATADAHNEPGRFTAFAAYEYSPPLPDRGKIHRNVIFANSQVPGQAISAYDAMSELDLWTRLDEDCEAPCEFLTIPHNPNKSWGLAFAGHTIDGIAYTEADWHMRDRYEPLVEMFQIKGNSECAIGFGTTDEECAFEQFLPRCEEGQETKCIHPTSMARSGLKRGLELDDELGFNPLDFGMIGSTDTHNSTPGDTEEWDWRGFNGLVSASARVRLPSEPGGNSRTLLNNPGGLAAIWAPENTREALFEAMQRKEVYATSGTRIRLRLFASFTFDEAMTDNADLLETAYETGVPMGSRLASSAGAQPRFLVWAMQDPDSAPLDRIQIVKGWTENGETFETVQDVACSDGRAPDADTKRCAATTASVDPATCAFDGSLGAAELKAQWTDPDYDAGQNAFYYARTIQNPTCRWSTYDSLRLGLTPPSNVPWTQTEMAWSSPIWIGAD